MAYSLLDDGFHSNPKIVAAGLPAAGLFARALSYCSDYLTDGNVPVQWVEDAAGRKYKAAIAELETRGLFVRRNDVFHIPKYLEYNPTREVVEQRRREKAKSGRKGATKRWGDSDSHSERIAVDMAEPMAKASQDDNEGDGEPIARARGTTNTYTNATTEEGSSPSLLQNPLPVARPPARDDEPPPRTDADIPELIDGGHGYLIPQPNPGFDLQPIGTVTAQALAAAKHQPEKRGT